MRMREIQRKNGVDDLSAETEISMNKKTLGMVILGGRLLAGCSHEHIWAPATCKEAKACLMCEKTEGEPLPHTYLSATCVQPEKCSACGVTRGELAPHTTEFGKCEVCNEIQNKKEIEKIFDKIKLANDYLYVTTELIESEWDEALDHVASATTEEEIIEILGGDTVAAYMVWCDEATYTIYYESKKEDCNSIVELFEEVYEMCDAYEEFAQVKEAAKAVSDKVPLEEPEVKEDRWAQHDRPFADYEEGELNAALLEWYIYWAPYEEKFVRLEESAKTFWEEVVKVANLFDIEVNESMWK